MTLITRDQLVGVGDAADGKISELNTWLKESYAAGNAGVCLDFDTWGYEYDDIQFIVDAGYMVERNGPCLWWWVTW